MYFYVWINKPFFVPNIHYGDRTFLWIRPTTDTLNRVQQMRTDKKSKIIISRYSITFYIPHASTWDQKKLRLLDRLTLGPVLPCLRLDPGPLNYIQINKKKKKNDLRTTLWVTARQSSTWSGLYQSLRLG